MKITKTAYLIGNEKIDKSRIDKKTLWEVASEEVHQYGGRECLKFVTMEIRADTSRECIPSIKPGW